MKTAVEVWVLLHTTSFLSEIRDVQPCVLNLFSERCSAALASLEAEKQHLLDQVNTVNEQYKKLHQQLDHMTELFDQKQVCT